MLLTHYLHDLKRLIASDRDYPFEQIDDRLVEHWMHTQRALWLRNEYNKNRSIESNVYQNIVGTELIQVDKSEAVWLPTTVKLLRTKNKIPRPIEINHKYLMKIKDEKIGSEEYSLEKFDQVRFKGHGKFNKKMVYGFYYNDYVYINVTQENPKIAMLNYLTINLVAENPSDVYRFLELNPMYQEYPIPASMWEYMKGAVMDSNITTFLSTKKDEKFVG